MAFSAADKSAEHDDMLRSFVRASRQGQAGEVTPETRR